MKRKVLVETIEGYLFLLPSIAVLGVFVFWPIGFSFVLSFFKWDFRNMRTPKFAAFSNYMEIFRFSQPPSYPFLTALLNTVLLLLLVFATVYFVISLINKDKRTAVMAGIGFLLAVAGMYVSWIYALLTIATGLFLIAMVLKTYRKFSFSHFWSILISLVVLYLLFRFFTPAGKDLFDWIADTRDKNDFIKALYNTGYYVILTVPTTLALALGIALLLNKPLKMRTAFRTAYFIPFVTSVVAVSLVWQWIFNDDYGLLNYFLSFFGIDKIAWLKDEKWTIPTIAIVSVWRMVGYDAVIFLAGLQNIDKFYYEAADVDGANSLQKFVYITWPLLSPTTFFLTIVSFIGAFKVFAEVFVLYQGLPGPYNNSGLTMVYYVFDLFYNQQRMGIACAAAYMLFGIILIFTALQFFVGRKMVEYVS